MPAVFSAKENSGFIQKVSRDPLISWKLGVYPSPRGWIISGFASNWLDISIWFSSGSWGFRGNLLENPIKDFPLGWKDSHGRRTLVAPAPFCRLGSSSVELQLPFLCRWGGHKPKGMWNPSVEGGSERNSLGSYWWYMWAAIATVGFLFSKIIKHLYWLACC